MRSLSAEVNVRRLSPRTGLAAGRDGEGRVRAVTLRPERDGRITGYNGLDTIRQRYGDCLIDNHIPPTGSATQPVEAGYMANAWLRMRHPDYDMLRSMLDKVGERLKVRVR